MATPKQRICVVMTTGTNDALKTELAVVTAFGLRKNGHDVVRGLGPRLWTPSRVLCTPTPPLVRTVCPS